MRPHIPVLSSCLPVCPPVHPSGQDSLLSCIISKFKARIFFAHYWKGKCSHSPKRRKSWGERIKLPWKVAASRLFFFFIMRLGARTATLGGSALLPLALLLSSLFSGPVRSGRVQSHPLSKWKKGFVTAKHFPHSEEPPPSPNGSWCPLSSVHCLVSKAAGHKPRRGFRLGFYLILDRRINWLYTEPNDLAFCVRSISILSTNRFNFQACFHHWSLLIC